MNVERRDIAMAVILTIVTCGIYAIYWLYRMVDDLYTINGLESKAAMDILLSLVTCGIYFIYLNYKMGTMLNDATGGMNSDKPVLFLILCIFGLSIVNYCILQSELNNKFAGTSGSNDRLQ